MTNVLMEQIFDGPPVPDGRRRIEKKPWREGWICREYVAGNPTDCTICSPKRQSDPPGEHDHGPFWFEYQFIGDTWKIVNHSWKLHYYPEPSRSVGWAEAVHARVKEIMAVWGPAGVPRALYDEFRNVLAQTIGKMDASTYQSMSDTWAAIETWKEDWAMTTFEDYQTRKVRGERLSIEEQKDLDKAIGFLQSDH